MHVADGLERFNVPWHASLARTAPTNSSANDLFMATRSRRGCAFSALFPVVLEISQRKKSIHKVRSDSFLSSKFCCVFVNLKEIGTGIGAQGGFISSGGVLADPSRHHSGRHFSQREAQARLFMGDSVRTGRREAPVGLIGVGIMGRGMALNLARSGRDVVVWNRNVDKSEALVKEVKEAQRTIWVDGLGGESRVEVAGAPSDVVERCHVTYSMLSTPQVARDVHFGQSKGTMEAMTQGKVLVECSTLDVQTMEEIHECVKVKGGQFLEAPVSGSKIPAEKGQLIFLCSGSPEAYKMISNSDLKSMGKASFFFGEKVGGGTKMKIIVNMIMGNMMVALAEGAGLAESCGLSHDDLNEVLKLGAMNNPLFSMKLPNMSNGNYETNFPLKHQQKDMRFAVALGDEVEQPLPLSAAANEIFKSACRLGLGERDFCAVMEVARRMRHNT